MTRATNPDGTPWWVSTGPPQPSAPTSGDGPSPAPSSPASEAQSSSESFLGMTAESQAAALNAGLNLVTAVLDIVSKPLNPKEEAVPEPHDPSTCGICPLCVGLQTLKEHDPALAELVESAMSGVTASVEKLSGLLPELAERAAEAFASSLVKMAFKNMTAK